jgi:PAS domain S-box-containing protein
MARASGIPLSKTHPLFAPSFLAGGGEMGELIRGFDWGATPLGPPQGWPAPLRTALRILLTTNHPIFVFWGPQHICFYNDAYSRSLGPEKHPSILGAKGRQAWDEIWPIIGPQIEQVMAGGGATWHENQLIPITRHGQLDEVYWTYSYGPIDDESAASGVGGVLVICAETTDQVLAERRLRAAESRWRELFEQAPGFVCILSGPEHRFEYANPRYLQLIGRRDIIGKTVINALPEVEAQGFLALLDRVFESGAAYTAEAAPVWLPRGAAGTPEQRFLDFVYQPIRDAQGRVTGIFVDGADVTDRKETEALLRAERKRLALALGAANAGIWAWDARTNALEWSPEQYALCHIDPAAGPISFAEWEALVHPDDRGDVANILNAFRADPQQTLRVEYRMTTPLGERWMLSVGNLEDPQRDQSRVTGINLDITDRKHYEEALRASEQRFREMADGVDAIMWVTDARGRIEFVNRGYCEFFGVSSEQVQTGGWRPPIHPEDRARYIEAFKQSLASHTVIRARARVRHASGQWRWLESRGEPRRDEAGRFIGHVGLSLDITDLLSSQEALRQADRRKDEFLATLAHELRNPLAPIRTATQLLSSTKLNDEQLSWARQVIQRQVKHMVFLLDDLLDVARITQGKLTLKKERVALNAVVDTAVEAARPLIDAKDHKLVVELPDDNPTIDGDPMRLAQIISNLLTNAAKYTDHGGEITLRAQVEGTLLSLSVKDTGIGVPPDAVDRIFEMFAQVRGAQSRSDGGLGIGLALAKGLLELHGGTIRVKSEGAGKGSEFVITVPLWVNGDATRPQRAPKAEDAPKPTGFRVLIADDNKDAADSLAILLGLAGHVVRVAHSGRSALAVANSFRPDVALLDIGMPELDGYEVAQHLRREPWGQSMRLIALTGWGQENDKRRAMEAGFDLHFTKPVDVDQVQALLAGDVARPR